MKTTMLRHTEVSATPEVKLMSCFRMKLFRMARLANRLILALLLGCGIGCGGPAYEYDAVVTGTVTIDGELANTGTVTFHPVKDLGKVAVGRIYPDGSFSMRTGQGDLRESDGGTVEPGEYIVTVMVSGPAPADAQTTEGGPPIAGPRLVHSKYLSKETSDLRRTVKAGRNVFDLRLERAEREPLADDEAKNDSAETNEMENDSSHSADQPAESSKTGEEPANDSARDTATERSPSDLDEEAAP